MVARIDKLPTQYPPGLVQLDGRSKQARLVRDTRAALINDLGRTPSVQDLIIIDRAAFLMLAISRDEAAMVRGESADHRLANIKTLSDLVAQLGTQCS